MKNSQMTMHRPAPLTNFVGWFFGIAVVAAGALNIGWGNDPFFGVFLVLLASIYFPPVTAAVREGTGFSFPPLLKIGGAIFIIVAVLGVGELFYKIDLMMMDL